MFTKYDIDIVRGGGSDFQARVEDRDTSSETATKKPGEALKRDADNYAILVADGDPLIATDILLGIASSESTETAVAGGDGYVELTQITPSTVLRGAAHTASNIDTLAKLDAVRYDYVTFNVSGVTETINENEGTDPNEHGLCILDGDIVKGTLDVAVHVNVTLSGSLVGQTID